MKRMTTLCLVLICAFFLAACGGGVDQSSYDKIENGMTLDEVKGILGEPTEGGGAGALGVSGGSYTWKDGDKTINLTFVNDKVTLKAKTGF